MYKKLLSLLCVLSLFCSGIPPLQANTFNDVQSSDWFGNYVEQLARANIVTTQNVNFYPYRTISRSELAKMAVLAAQSQNLIRSLEVPDQGSFCDVLKSEWAYPYVETLAVQQLVSGTTANCQPQRKNFLPNSPITRAEALKVLLNTYNISIGNANTNFADVERSMWYSAYIAKAVQLGLVNGYPDGTFKPNGFLSRAEMSKIIVKLMQTIEAPTRPTPSPTPSSTTSPSSSPSSSTPSPSTSSSTELTYSIGTPNVQDIWISNGGNDNNTGSQAAPLATFARAWEMIPQNQNLAQGYRIHMMAGTYDQDSLPNYLENRFGTSQTPIILQAEGRVQINGNLNVFNTKYFYLIGLRFTSEHDVLHFEKSDHILLKNLTLRSNNRSAQETLKVNQSQYIYVEDSDISGAHDNAIDFVAVQYGHTVRNKIYDAEDWCMYTKGGSAYYRVESNEFYNCGTGGFTAGQGTGFEFMTSPWIHYEAYDIRVVNNVIHDIDGAGLGVNGGYNILLAHNTLYKVGKRDHVIEVVFGLRTCDGNTNECQNRINQGGWGSTNEEVFIGNKHVYIFNNIVYNPSPYRSRWTQFAIYGPREQPIGTRNAPLTAIADADLQIKGNIIWNGPTDMELGVGDEEGCQDNNPTCNALQLTRDNAINTFEPQFVGAGSGDFRPTTTSNILTARTVPFPTLNWNDAPSSPRAPTGNVIALPFTKYRSGFNASSPHPGAY